MGGGNSGNLELLRQLSELKQNVRKALWWNFLGYYQIGTETKEISAPKTNEVLLFVGQQNNAQVYGGRSYIIPSNDSGGNIVNEHEIKNSNGTVIATNFYTAYAGNKLIMSTKTGTVLVRVYYR